jgi:SPP1 gp7 family putative phage head morphogenesis protein
MISLFSKAIERSLKVRSLDYSREIPRNIRREFGSRTYAVQLDGILTEIIKQSLLYADGQMKKLSAASVNESHILTKEAVRLSTELGQNVAESIIRTLQDDKIYYQHPNTLARGLKDLWGGERYKAIRFTRTFTADVATATTVHRYRQYGVEYMEFDAELDDRTTDQCRALHGTVFDLSKGDVDIYRPPTHHHCRSGLVPVLITEEIDESKMFENQDFTGFEKAFGDIDTFNEKYRIDKFVLDQDISARIMSEKGLSVSIPAKVQESIQQTGLEAIVRSYEAEIKNKPYENCYAFGPEGNILLSKSGSVDTIVITREEGARLKGAIFTHNHPRSSSFSPADINTSCNTELKEIRVASSKYSYSMRLKDGSNFSRTLWDDIEPAMNHHYYDVKFEFTAKIATGEMPLEDAELQHWHEVWSRVVKDIDKLEYIRT